MQTQDGKSFEKDVQYTIDLAGDSIQPCLATLADCIKILQAESNRLNAQYVAVKHRIRYLELMRDKLWHCEPLSNQLQDGSDY